MTREEQIREAARRHDYDDVVFGEIFAEGARWADAHPAWISGEDKPRENGFYLCYSDKEKAYEILSLYGADWYDAYGHYIPSCDVTHWMPLPIPPSESVTTCNHKTSSSSEISNNLKGGEQ